MRSLAVTFAASLSLVSAAVHAKGDGVSPPPLQPTLEQATLLRCSAAFAIIASDQARGDESALAYPPLGERGMEYFVRSSARLMDELALTRESLQDLLAAEVVRLREPSGSADRPGAMVDAVMQPCLLSLEASGL